jgi:hypothetical protein
MTKRGAEVHLDNVALLKGAHRITSAPTSAPQSASVG